MIGYSWRQLTPAHHPSARVTPGLAYGFVTGEKMLFGGLGTAPELKADTWKWDGTDWTQLAPAASPGARNAPAMAYDFNLGATLLFGGVIDVAGNGDAQTWKFDGVTWTQLAPVHSPSARAGAIMWWASGIGRVMLFGGRTNPLVPTWSNELWSWDGTDWTQLAPAASPVARADPSLAYSQARVVADLFGGNIIGTGDQSDTWRYNGFTWSQLAPAASPSARQSATMIEFAATNDLVLFGGLVPATTTFADTWAWDGTAWTDVSPATSPSARYGHAFDWDGLNSVGLLFGGATSGGGYLSDTWVLERASASYDVSLARGGVASIAPDSPQVAGSKTLDQMGMPRIMLDDGCTVEVSTYNLDGTQRTTDALSDIKLWVEDEQG